MDSKKMFLSLIPWVIFTVGVQALGPASAGLASIAALACAVILLMINSRGGLKLIDLTGIVTFGAMSVLALAGGAGVADLVADFGRGGSALVLSVVMLVSAVTVPFTEVYARESVPREFWHSSAFRSVNRRISATWGAIIAAIACGHLAYGYLASVSPDGLVPRPGNLILNWAIPIGLVYLGIHLTTKASEQASRQEAPATR